MGIWLTGLTATRPQGICDLRHTLTFGILFVSASSAAKLSVSYGALFRLWRCWVAAKVENWDA